LTSVLSRHPAIAEIAVAGLLDERLGQRVTAFIRRAAAVEADELDAWSRNSPLADYNGGAPGSLLPRFRNRRSAKSCAASSSPANMKETPDDRRRFGSLGI